MGTNVVIQRGHDTVNATENHLDSRAIKDKIGRIDERLTLEVMKMNKVV